MIVVGGTYAERCRYPHWDRLFGSGLRAAIAVSSVSANVELHTYAAADFRDDILATLSGAGIEAFLSPSVLTGTFDWLHPFELVSVPNVERVERPLSVDGDCVLRFGMLEGDALVRGGRVVYDPQAEWPAEFASNGSQADELAIVLSRRELVKMANPDPDQKVEPNKIAVREALVSLFSARSSGTLLILLKDGVGGVTVHLGDEPTNIATYAAESFFRIGSGDVFAAAFAHAWAEKRQGAIDAADYAARCVAYFVEGPRLPIPPSNELPTRRFLQSQTGEVRVLSHESFEMGLLLTHTEAWLQDLGCKPQMELFPLGTEPKTDVPAMILIGPKCSGASLVQLSERARGPGRRVVYWPGISKDVCDSYFPGARLTDDYATALYFTLRGEPA